MVAAAAAAKSLQSCPTLCDPMDCSLPGFSVHGILQARTLEWVAIKFYFLRAGFEETILCCWREPEKATLQSHEVLIFAEQSWWQVIIIG